jgi:hypothetical protein
MEIDPKEFRQLVVYLLQTFRRMEQELLAHQIVVLGIRRSQLLGVELDVLLDAARDCHELRQHLHEKYDGPLERFSAAIEAEFAAEDALDVLRNCKPPNPDEPVQ